MLIIENEEYFDQVVSWAEKNKLYRPARGGPLEDHLTLHCALEKLRNFGRGSKAPVVCKLYPDSMVGDACNYSFGFCMYHRVPVRDKDGDQVKYLPLKCGGCSEEHKAIAPGLEASIGSERGRIFLYDRTIAEHPDPQRGYYCWKCGCNYSIANPITIKRSGDWTPMTRDVFWFNGGLIFHGPHDNGGDGGAPTFSVNLGVGYGWAMHT